MLVYSIASRDSFAEMKAFREQIHKVKASDKVPIVLGKFSKLSFIGLSDWLINQRATLV